jgi:hypothetical protein
MREEPAMQPLLSCCFWSLTLEQSPKALRLQLAIPDLGAAAVLPLPGVKSICPKALLRGRLVTMFYKTRRVSLSHPDKSKATSTDERSVHQDESSLIYLYVYAEHTYGD